MFTYIDLHRLDYLSLQQLWYYFLNCVYPNPSSQPSMWEETGTHGENPQLSVECWLTLFTWVRSKNRTHVGSHRWKELEHSDDCAPEVTSCILLWHCNLWGNVGRTWEQRVNTRRQPSVLLAFHAWIVATSMNSKLLKEIETPGCENSRFFNSRTWLVHQLL
jgi:hypothetical protein